MSKHSHPVKNTTEQVLHVKRLLSSAKRTPAGRLGHGEGARIAREAGVSRCTINMISNGTYWSRLPGPAE